jgi:hypothetical protein
MSENIARNMYSSQGTINYPTQLHLVCHFRKLYHDARNHEYQAYKHCVNVMDSWCYRRLCTSGGSSPVYEMSRPYFDWYFVCFPLSPHLLKTMSDIVHVPFIWWGITAYSFADKLCQRCRPFRISSEKKETEICDFKLSSSLSHMFSWQGSLVKTTDSSDFFTLLFGFNHEILWPDLSFDFFPQFCLVPSCTSVSFRFGI